MTRWGERHDVMASMAASAAAILIAMVMAFAAWALVTIATEGIQAVIS